MSYVAFRIVLTDLPRVVSLDEEVEALLGFTRQDFLEAKVNLKDCVHRDDAALFDSLFFRDLQDSSGAVNLRLRRADGRILCTCGHFKKESSRDGTVTLELHLADARTVKAPSDASLVNSFKSIIEHSTDYIYVKNRNHVILAASQALPKLIEFNGGRTELVGTTDYDNHPESTADIYYALEEKAFAEGRRTNLIHQVLLRDGTKRWIDNRKYPINGPDGEIIGIFGVAPDITEYIEVQNRLRGSEEQLRQAEKIAGLGSYILNIPKMQWTVSPELMTLVGSRQELVAGFDEMWRYIHPDDRAWVAKRFDGYFRGQGTPFDLEYRLVRGTDGETRWIHTRGRLEFDADGQPVSLKGTIQDITEQKQAQDALKESRDLLQLFVDRAPAALAMFDREMRYLSVSRRWLEDYELVGIEVVGRSHYEVFPDIPERWKAVHRRGMAGETLKSDEDRFDRADGTVQWIRWEVVPWRKGDGSIGGIVICSEDITPQKESENRLRLAASVFTGAREGITITDDKGAILDVNAAFTRITGYSREEALGRNPSILKSGLQSREFYENMWNCLLRDGHWSNEIWNRSKCGDIYPEAITINAIRDADGKTTNYVALFSDISEIKEHELQLEHIAHFDALTGLPNRALFADRLRQAMGQAQRSKHALAVVHIDLDGFKTINDRYGHSVGDGLLTAIAFRMKRALRDGDTLARLGGDEFAVVMLELDHDSAAVPALNRLLQTTSEEAQIGNVTLRVSASAGVTFYPQLEEVDADGLLRQAGQAMYQAKLAGGNRFHKFDPGQDLIARSRHENLEHIRKGLAEHQFVLHYQPMVNMRTGKVVGVEALVRWKHPDRGLLPPGMFLPVIENHPLQVELGQWAIATALTQLESWKSSGLDLSLSVNVSAIELQQPDFVDRLRAHLAAHPMVNPSSLALEVVETTALQDVMQTSHVLTDCRGIGVSIALDDFGIGYSSLTYLRRLPANILKIDQSFVRDMLEEPENFNILEGVMGLAAAFRRDVVVEGVETVEHGLMLLQMGCEIAQGYGIARPMPANELPGWAAVWRPDPRWDDVPLVHANNRPVLYACVEHRAWLSAFEACLQGRRTAPPSLDASDCRIGAWLDSEKRSSRGTFASLQAIETLHRQLHGLAAEIFESQADGRNSEGLARLEQLHTLHDKCLSRLRPFTRIARSGGKRRSVEAPARSRAKRA
jgi:diguanylate cyclase (GGDEF)-like protein/PAS domain S-box-containing protein